MRRLLEIHRGALLLSILLAALAWLAEPVAAQPKPNIIMIMGDDVGWFNIGAYHQGIMASRTPNLDRLAAEGMRFTDYYAEASCTAGAPISSPASWRSARGSPPLVRPALRSACRRRRPPLPRC